MYKIWPTKETKEFLEKGQEKNTAFLEQRQTPSRGSRAYAIFYKRFWVKRPIHMKRDLCVMKEAYNRDLCVRKEAYKRDVSTFKTGQQKNSVLGAMANAKPRNSFNLLLTIPGKKTCVHTQSKWKDPNVYEKRATETDLFLFTWSLLKVIGLFWYI